MKKKILIVYGTRPEFIKLISLILELRANEAVETIVINTGQHKELVRELEEATGIEPDVNLHVMMENQNPNHVITKTIGLFEELLNLHQPDLVIVQGDTTTVLAVGICCFNRKVKVGHVEAGLRSFDIDSPFPEEFNRRVVSMFATYHFAPTTLAMENLKKEGIPEEKIFLTGNTVIDALRLIDEDVLNASKKNLPSFDGRKMILVTAHRRENYGEGIHQICVAIKELQKKHKDIVFVWPVHPNPNVKNEVYDMLSDLERVNLLAPMDYFDLVSYMRASFLVLTDSGGIQEEVPYFKKPVVVLRKETERPEVIHSGFGVLVGTDKQLIVKEVTDLLENKRRYQQMTEGNNPFGNGRAAEKIIQIIQN